MRERMKKGLFRFGVIAPLVCRRLEVGERQDLRQRIGQEIYTWSDGRQKRVGERTLGRWLSRYRSHGFDGLLDVDRPGGGVCRGIETEVLLKAEQLRRELPKNKGRRMSLATTRDGSRRRSMTCGRLILLMVCGCRIRGIRRKAGSAN